MRKLVFITSLLVVIGCNNQPTEQTIPAVPQHITTPLPAVPQPPKVEPKHEADGEYVSATLPCRCGDVLVYVPNSCPCFDKEHYPDLAANLDNLYAWVKSHCRGSGKKVVGKYEILTLQCGCALQVYVPGSSGCLEKQSPDLAELLRTVYATAKKHEDKQQAIQ